MIPENLFQKENTRNKKIFGWVVAAIAIVLVVWGALVANVKKQQPVNATTEFDSAMFYYGEFQKAYTANYLVQAEYCAKKYRFHLRRYDSLVDNFLWHRNDAFWRDSGMTYFDTTRVNITTSGDNSPAIYNDTGNVIINYK